MPLLEADNLTRCFGGLSAVSDLNGAGKAMRDGPFDRRRGRGRFRLN